MNPPLPSNSQKPQHAPHAPLGPGGFNADNLASTGTGGEGEHPTQEKELLELLQMLESHTPIIPDNLMDYYMTKAGVECDDVRLKRLVALIGQKFITDVVNDAMHFHRLRVGGGASSAIGSMGRGAMGGKKNTLTLEDLSAALAEYGINIRRPPYHT